MGWYRVIKTIKGHRYEYLQRTWREGKRVRTESRYLGPAAPESGGVKRHGEPPSERVNTTTRILYHGSLHAWEGSPQASGDGLMGPGFYLAPTPHIAAYFGSQQSTKLGRETVKDAEPVVYSFDVSSLRFIELADKYGFFDFLDDFLGRERRVGDIFKDDIGQLQKHLIGKGYDGIMLTRRGEAMVFPASMGKMARVNTTPRIFYHGSRGSLTGALEPSASGTFGPGFYLTTKERAERYAEHEARIAAKIIAGEEGGQPELDGHVYAFDVSALRLKEFTWEQYLERCEALDPLGAATPEAKAKLQQLLAAEGYDGLYVPDDVRHELVIFPGSISKMKVAES